MHKGDLQVLKNILCTDNAEVEEQPSMLKSRRNVLKNDALVSSTSLFC